VEQALHRYISGGKYVVTRATYKHPDIDRDMTVTSVAEADLQACLGTLLADIDRAADAKPYLDRAAALLPDSPRIHQTLGFLAFREKDFAASREHFEQAVAGDSPNYLAHYYYAAALFNEKIGQHFILGRVAPATARTVGAEAHRAVQLMPTYAPAYDLLGLIHLAANDNLPEGIKMAGTAIRLDPLNLQFRLTLAQLQLAQHDEAAARATLRPIFDADADPDLKASAQSIVREIDRRNAGH
jgi:tetratricopeptide (TPR) repeat protein